MARFFLFAKKHSLFAVFFLHIRWPFKFSVAQRSCHFMLPARYFYLCGPPFDDREQTGSAR